jgi:hypothetical protein
MKKIIKLHNETIANLLGIFLYTIDTVKDLLTRWASCYHIGKINPKRRNPMQFYTKQHKFYCGIDPVAAFETKSELR